MIDWRLNLNGHSTAAKAQIYSRYRPKQGFWTLWPLQAYVDGDEWENKTCLSLSLYLASSRYWMLVAIALTWG